MRRWIFYLALSMMLLLLAACQQETPLPTQAAVAEIDQTVEAAVSATLQAQQGGGQLNPPATWTVIPVVNADTPEPETTQPAPSTSTPLPTVTVAATETPFIPTNTPRPTETAVPPTNTPVPTSAQPQPTSPPPAPTAPPNPVYGANILANGSFEDGWYNQNGIPELQLPNQWGFEYDEGPTGYGDEPWDKWVRPETRVLPDFQLPENERGLFIRDGQYTIKMFKGSGAISFRVYQDIALQPGTYTFQVNIFPDLVMNYDGGKKNWAGDPASGEIRFITPDGGTGWIFPAFGTWNTLEHTFSIAEAQTVRIGVGIRGRYALVNNGWFFDQWSLKPVQ
ncbi:MAG: hypothetical protein KC419_03830 [Anaerolineales bacterium]|nr:hypothetical protein [Anaerolineales bacterium]MCA9927575.1 hypothetical protein [Anaerolineales bacterium]